MFLFALWEKRHGWKCAFFLGGNQLFCNTVHLKHFYMCNSHELQLFDKSVMMKGRADYRSVCSCTFLFHK